MRVRKLIMKTVAGTLLLGLAACGSEGPVLSDENDMKVSDQETPLPDAVFPRSLAVLGSGFPDSGDPCRRLGESSATINWLDDSAILVGCPTQAAAKALKGKIVDVVEGITLVSVPMGEANVSMNLPVGAELGVNDALVSGTDYNATAPIPCSNDGGATTGSCSAGVKRKWGEDGTTLVEITKADGRKRAIFFQGTRAYGADSAQADGSAAYEFRASRRGDETLVSFGPERYVIPDALVEGG